jgi:hypothetical protein
MEWHDNFISLLDRNFQVEHLTSPGGRSYGAGRPVSAQQLLEAAIPREEVEYYADLLVDEWAAQHIIDQAFGLDTLLDFELASDSETPDLVQFFLLDLNVGRLFVARMVRGRALEFLFAVDPGAAGTLISATVLAMLASGTALSLEGASVPLPGSIVNYRSDLIPRDVLKRGMSLMFDRDAGDDQSLWIDAAARVHMEPTASHDEIIEAFLGLAYTEVERW